MDVYRQSNVYWYDSPTHSGGIPLILTQPHETGPPEGYDQFLKSIEDEAADGDYSPGRIERLREEFARKVREEYGDENRPESSENYDKEESRKSQDVNEPTTPVSRRPGRPSITPRNIIPSENQDKKSLLNDTLDDDDLAEVCLVGSQCIQAYLDEEAKKAKIRQAPVPSQPTQAQKCQLKRLQTQTSVRIVAQRKPVHPVQSKHIIHQAPVKPTVTYQPTFTNRSRAYNSTGCAPSITTYHKVAAQQRLAPHKPVATAKPPVAQTGPTSLQSKPILLNRQVQKPVKPTPANQGSRPLLASQRTLIVMPRYSQKVRTPARKTSSCSTFNRKTPETKRNTLPGNLDRTNSVDDDFYDDSFLEGLNLQL